MFEWSDLRYFVAVAKSGSTSGAAQVTRVSQTTVARRISALEDALGLKLIERTQTGSRLTEAGEQLRSAAEHVEAAARAFDEAVETARRRLAGVIRFTMPPEAVEELMSNPVRRFMEDHPGVKVEIHATQAYLDIANGEADLALRAGRAPDNPDLIVRRLSTIEWACFCSPAYAERSPPLKHTADLNDHPVIGADGQLAQSAPMQWLAAQTAFAYTGSSIATMASFAKAGLGVVMLPLTYGDPEEGLVRCFGPLPEMGDSLWIVTRDEVRRQPAVRAFIDFLIAHLSALEHRGLKRA